ncbi:ANTAR domain-containing protein, partial [Streptomyces montanisoli]
GGAGGAGGADGALRAEVFGLRAKARSHGLIDFAQGIVLARYRLARPTAALVLLKQVSQERNVPLRVLASAVVAAPAPPRASGAWFPGRRRTPPPEPAFLSAHDAASGGRARVLQAAVDAAVAHARSDAAALHLADPAQGGALVLEAHRGLGTAYRDAYAHIAAAGTATGTAGTAGTEVTAPAVARAQATGLLVAGTETVPAFAGRPSEDDRFGAVPNAVHAVPLVLPGGRCTGTLSVQHTRADMELAPQGEAALRSLASDVAAWHSWYQRTVLLDALELLHARAADHRV